MREREGGGYIPVSPIMIYLKRYAYDMVGREWGERERERERERGREGKRERRNENQRLKQDIYSK